MHADSLLSRLEQSQNVKKLDYEKRDSKSVRFQKSEFPEKKELKKKGIVRTFISGLLTGSKHKKESVERGKIYISSIQKEPKTTKRLSKDQKKDGIDFIDIIIPRKKRGFFFPGKNKKASPNKTKQQHEDKNKENKVTSV